MSLMSVLVVMELLYVLQRHVWVYLLQLRKADTVIHRTACGSGGIAPLIFNLRTRCQEALSYTPRPLKPRVKSAPHIFP